MPMFSGMTFSMAIIFTSSGVAITPEIDMADKKCAWGDKIPSLNCNIRVRVYTILDIYTALKN